MQVSPIKVDQSFQTEHRDSPAKQVEKFNQTVQTISEVGDGEHKSLVNVSSISLQTDPIHRQEQQNQTIPKPEVRELSVQASIYPEQRDESFQTPSVLKSDSQIQTSIQLHDHQQQVDLSRCLSEVKEIQTEMYIQSNQQIQTDNSCLINQEIQTDSHISHVIDRNDMVDNQLTFRDNLELDNSQIQPHEPEQYKDLSNMFNVNRDFSALLSSDKDEFDVIVNGPTDPKLEEVSMLTKPEEPAVDTAEAF